jgi:flagellar biosynthesis GTPase FlhF
MKQLDDLNADLQSFKLLHENSVGNSDARNALGTVYLSGVGENILPGANLPVNGFDFSAHLREIVEVCRRVSPNKTAEQIKDEHMQTMFLTYTKRERELNDSIFALKRAAAKEKREAVEKYDAKISDLTHSDEFYKGLYYEQMVKDKVTDELITDEFSQVIPIWKQYQKQNQALLEEIEQLKEITPKQETLRLLRNVQQKARTFKRKYRFVKGYIIENCYVQSPDDLYCEAEAKHDDDSDEELRSEPRRWIQLQDPALLPGFSLRPSKADD